MNVIMIYDRMFTFLYPGRFQGRFRVLCVRNEFVRSRDHSESTVQQTRLHSSKPHHLCRRPLVQVKIQSNLGEVTECS